MRGHGKGRLTIATLAIVGWQADGSLAADWQVLTEFDQEFIADSNIRVANDPEGFIAGSITQAGLLVNLSRNTTTVQLQPGLSIRRFFGPGSDSTLDSADPKFDARFSHLGKRIEAEATFSFRRLPTTFTEVDDTAITETEAIRSSYVFDAGAAYRVNGRTEVGVTAGTDARRFSDEGGGFLVPTTTIGAGAFLRSRLTPRTAARATIGARDFTADGDEQDTNSQIYEAAAIIEQSLNRRLSLEYGLGVTYVDTSTTGLGSVAAGSEDEVLGGIGGASLRYELPRLGLEVTGEKDVTPSSFGRLRDRSALGLALDYQINALWNFDFDAQFSRTSALSDDDSPTIERFGLAPGLSYRLTPNSELEFALGFRGRSDGTQWAYSTGGLIRFNHEFVLLP